MGKGKMIDLRNIKVDIEKKIEEHNKKIRETMGEYGQIGRDLIEGDLGAKSGYKTILKIFSLNESLMSDNDDWIMLVLNNEIKQCNIFLESARSCGVAYQIKRFGGQKTVYEDIKKEMRRT